MSDTEVPVRPAATVMLVRDGVDGIEVFMLRRTRNAVFAGGMYVFPGGRVEPADGEGEEAFLVAAIRECYEEAGVLLVDELDGSTVADGHPVLGHRDAVYAGEIDLHALCTEHHLRLATERMAWISHWITPKGEAPRRFDTRFFLAAAPAGQTSTHDDNETVASEWIRPADALERADRGEMALMPPTVANLQFLGRYASSAQALSAGHAQGRPPVILPKLRVAVDGRVAGIAMPDDEDYDALD